MRAKPIKGLDPAKSLRRNAKRIVRTRLKEMEGFAEEALDPAAAGAQHDMRIAAKRLRYVLEIVADCFGPEALGAQRAAKALQSVLGEIHDCDVMLPKVSEIPSLQGLLRTRRELLHRSFRELWSSEVSSDTWGALRASL